MHNINSNGNSSTNTFSNTHNNIRKRITRLNFFSTKGFMLVGNSTDERGKNKIPYNSRQCSKTNTNDSSATMSQIVLLKQQVIAMQQQIQAGTKTSISNNVRHNRQSISNKMYDMPINSNITNNGRNINDSATQRANTNNDISIKSDNNNNNNDINSVSRLINGSPNNVLFCCLSQILSTGHVNVNNNNKNIFIFLLNQLLCGNLLRCFLENKVIELLCILRQLELFMANNHVSNNISPSLGLFGSNINNYPNSNDVDIESIRPCQILMK